MHPTLVSFLPPSLSHTSYQITSASGNANISLKQVMASLPLDKSAVYHYRFKVKDDRFGYGWQDMRDPNGIVPVANGVVYAKVCFHVEYRAV